MGVFDRWRAAHMKDPVDGTFTIAAVRLLSRTPGFYMEFDVDGVVVAPGVKPTPLHRGSVLVKERDALAVGQSFSAVVDRVDPRRCVVTFPSTRTSSGTSSAQGAAAAEALARRMSEGQPPAQD